MAEILSVSSVAIRFRISLLFMMSNILILSFFLKKIGKIRILVSFGFIPVIAGVFDYLENFGLIYLLTSYPKISEIGVRIISTFTVIKVYLQAYIL